MRFRSSRQRKAAFARMRGSGICLPSNHQIKGDIRGGDIHHTLRDSDKRSNRAKLQDFNLEANDTRKPNTIKNIERWAENPDHKDLEGVDTKQVTVEEKQGYGGRASAKGEIKKALGDNADIYDIEAETDSSLSSREQAEDIKSKLNPRMKDLSYE